MISRNVGFDHEPETLEQKKFVHRCAAVCSPGGTGLYSLQHLLLNLRQGHMHSLDNDSLEHAHVEGESPDCAHTKF